MITALFIAANILSESLTGSTVQNPTLTQQGLPGIGQFAPPLKVEKWLVGDQPPPGSIVVIDIWSMGFMTSISTLPGLRRLAEKYSGRVEFVALNADSKTVDTTMAEPELRRLLRGLPNNSKLRVAIDEENATTNQWMKLTNQTMVPCSFLIGSDGKFLWAGNPSFGLDQAIDSALAGTLDIHKAEQLNQEREELLVKVGQLLSDIRAQISDKQYELALTTAKKIRDVAPVDLPMGDLAEYSVLNYKDSAEAHRFGMQLVSKWRDEPGSLFVFSDVALGLSRDPPGMHKDPWLALTLLKEAAMTWGTDEMDIEAEMAVAYDMIGQFDLALSNQKDYLKQEMSLVFKDPRIKDRVVGEAKTALAKYEDDARKATTKHS